MIELLIGAVVAAGVGRYIIKGYSATGVLMVGGLLLLGISALMGKTLLPSGAASTGWRATDMIEYVKILLMSRGGDLGMMIMMLCGFAAYMTHIGANDVVVKLASRPLQMINSPYLLMVAAYFVACLMSLAVSSATGLGVLLMATLFPLMVNVGISRGRRRPFALRRRRLFWRRPLATWCWRPRRRRCRWWTSRSKPRCRSRLPPSSAWPWRTFLAALSRQKNNEQHHIMDVSEINTHAPGFYAILPFTPILGVLIFDGKWGRSCISLPYWSGAYCWRP